MVTETQKNIYNWYLRAQRVHNNLPFRYRKNFDRIENEKFYPSLVKIEKFFTQFPHFLRKEFFDAPYVVYKDEKKYYSLDFFSSMKGISTCVAYFKICQQQKPDEQMDFIKDSLKFIAKFCIANKIHLKDYVRYKSIAQNDCLKHLKNHQISWYMAIALNGFLALLLGMPRDEFTLYFGDEIDLNKLIGAYGSSILAKPFIETRLKELDNLITKNLNFTR